MYFFQAALILIAVATRVIISTPIRTQNSVYALKESHNVPSQWTRMEAPPPQHVIKLHIGLKQAELDSLKTHLMEGN